MKSNRHSEFRVSGHSLPTPFSCSADGEATVEEGFLTVQNIGLGNLPLSATVGRRKVPFGRVNQLHPHSWPYIVQPYVLSNLVSGESLTGDGGYLSYLLPTGRLFAQLDAWFLEPYRRRPKTSTHRPIRRSRSLRRRARAWPTSF
jgi:hypothetical protein